MSVKKKLNLYLQEFVTPEKAENFQSVIENRTRYLTVVLEDIYQPQNASAVLRTCDCYGIQDVHIIENQNKYRINPDVVLGADKWLNLFRYNKKKSNTIDAIKALKNDGYRIVATSLQNNSIPIDDLNLKQGKIALIFGTETRGISKEVMKNSDEFLKIPMYGFTKSFNISVSAAIIIHHLTEKLRNSGFQWKLSEDEKDDILLEWFQKSIKSSKLIISDYLKKSSGNNDFPI
ncbi:MAG: RNA methyltransferase [Bacteroidota bacterium]